MSGQPKLRPLNHPVVFTPHSQMQTPPPAMPQPKESIEYVPVQGSTTYKINRVSSTAEADVSIQTTRVVPTESKRIPQRVLFDEIESHQEKNMLQRESLTNRVQKSFTTLFQTKKTKGETVKPATTTSPQSTAAATAKPSTPAQAQARPITAESLAKGVTPEHLNQIVQLFQNDELLSKETVMAILDMAFDLFRDKENVNKITHEQVFAKRRTVIVGDLHGQYEDLCYILGAYGTPSDLNAYVFNGDFVDRGKKSVEVVLTLFCLALCYPNCVYLNRGNHELRSINAQYGFQEELARKRYDFEVFDRFQDIFNHIPLATTIGKKVIVIHGGISINVTSLEDILRIDRRVDTTRVSPIIDELLWSDPQPIGGIQHNARGAGLKFGADATERFLELLGFTTLIRSHEVKDNGYEVAHNGRCITLFSASNYTGTYGNKGAVAILDHASRLHMFTYTSADVTKKTSVVFNEKQLEESNMIYLAELIFENKNSLLEKFKLAEQEEKKKVASRKGLITNECWVSVMTELFPNLSWEQFRTYIAPGARPGFIDYNIFLNQYDLDSPKLKAWEEEIAQKVARKIYVSRNSLEVEFKKMDVNGDGVLSYAEFQSALEQMNLGLGKEQLTHFVISVDDDMDGNVSYNEFMSRFKMKFKKTLRLLSESEAAEVEDLINKLGNMLLEKSLSAKEAFAHFDQDQSGYITSDELIETLKTMFSITLSEFQSRYLLDLLDSDSDNKISCDEFLHAVEVVDSKAMGSSLISIFASKLFRNRATLRSAFYYLDLDGSGTITRDEFTQGLSALNEQLSEPFSPTEVETLMETLDVNKDGEISYDEFVGTFSSVVFKKSVA